MKTYAKNGSAVVFTIRENLRGGALPTARFKTRDSVQCGFNAWYEYEHMSPTSTDSPDQVATAASSVSGCSGRQLPLPPHPRRVHDRLRRCSEQASAILLLPSRLAWAEICFTVYLYIMKMTKVSECSKLTNSYFYQNDTH